MKKINPFKLYACLIGGFLFSILLIVSIIINVVWYSQKQYHRTYNSIDAFKESEVTPFYDMYDAYEYIINDKEILMSDKQLYIIERYYPIQYNMQDVGTTQLNAKYTISYESLEQSPIYYEHDEPIFNGHLYIAATHDYPDGIEFSYVDKNKPLYYVVNLTITNKGDISIDDYIDKVKDYILLTETYNSK